MILGISFQLKDVIAFNERERDRVMPFFGQELMHQSEAKGPLTEKVYRDALAKCRLLSRTRGIDAVMRRHSELRQTSSIRA